MKKILLVLTSCMLLGIAFASCKSTRESVPAQSAVTDDSTITIPAENAK